MKKYICTKALFLEEYDDNGFFVEGSAKMISVGDVFELDDSGFRMVGGSDTIRLQNARHWLEVLPNTLAEYFMKLEATNEPTD